MSQTAATRPLLACCGRQSTQAPEKVRQPCWHVPQEECTAVVASHPSAWAVPSGKEGAELQFHSLRHTLSCPVMWLCCWHAGRTVDDRLRRRKALEDAEISPSSNGHPGDGAQQPSGQLLWPACGF